MYLVAKHGEKIELKSFSFADVSIENAFFCGFLRYRDVSILIMPQLIPMF